LEAGQEYRFWACFISDNGVFSEPGDTINLIFKNTEENNPPYFTLDPDGIFFFMEKQQKQYELTANDADGDILTFHIPYDTLGIMIANNNLIWTPAEGDRGVYDLMITVSDGSATDTIYHQLIVHTSHQVGVSLDFNSKNLYESDNMFVKINNYFCPDYYQLVTLKNIRTQEQTNVETRRVNDFEYIGHFSLSVLKRTDISVRNGDTIEAKYIYQDQEFVAYAFYDSVPQPSDIISPGLISDLRIESLPDNFIKLKWTATGNDLNIGKAYRYDIRYAYESINSEDMYYSAYRILTYPYPALAGLKDSLIINLMDLENISQHAIVYFSIKAEDEMQNRGGLSNSPGIQYASNIPEVETDSPFFKIQPNPNDGFFTLEIPDPIKLSGIRVEIFDMMGELLMRDELWGQRTYEFDLSAKPSGIYFIKVTQDEAQGVMMIIRK
jgi:hypothetical protein